MEEFAVLQHVMNVNSCLLVAMDAKHTAIARAAAQDLFPGVSVTSVPSLAEAPLTVPDDSRGIVITPILQAERAGNRS